MIQKCAGNPELVIQGQSAWKASWRRWCLHHYLKEQTRDSLVRSESFEQVNKVSLKIFSQEFLSLHWGRLLTLPRLGVGQNFSEYWESCGPLMAQAHLGLLFYFFLTYFLIGGKLLYNVVIVSATQCKSVIIMHIASPFWASLHSPVPAL